jgi:hypothetical protein
VPPVKLCSTVSLPLGASLKTSPQLPLHAEEMPPKTVVPYKFPAATRTVSAS